MDVVIEGVDVMTDGDEGLVVLVVVVGIAAVAELDVEGT